MKAYPIFLRSAGSVLSHAMANASNALLKKTKQLLLFFFDDKNTTVLTCRTSHFIKILSSFFSDTCLKARIGSQRGNG